MANLGTAYISIVPSTGGMGSAISKDLNKTAPTAGAKAGAGMGAALKGAILQYASPALIGQAIMTSIQKGAALEQSLGGVETLFKDHADIVIANADNAYKTAGISANKYMEQATSFSASLLQSLGGDTKAAAKYADMAIIDMSDNANKMGTDMEMIQNAYQGFAKQNYTMLDNLKLGYGGTKGEMERLLADAEKITGKDYSIDSLSDVYEAIHVIQGELDITGTSAEEAASTLSGSFNAMKAAAENFMANITLGRDVGKSLGNLATSAATFLFGNLVPALVNIAKGLPQALFAVIETAIPQLLSKIPQFIKQAGSVLPSIINQLSDWLMTGVESIGNGNDGKMMASVGKFIMKLGSALLKNAGKLVIALGKLFFIAIPKALYAVSTQMHTSIRNAISKGLSSAVSVAKAKFNQIKTACLAPINQLRDKVRSIINTIKGFFNFKTSTPKIKMPHFSISPKGWKVGDLLKGKIPKLGIKWYAKGGVFDSPSVIGVGEKGPEAVVPLNRFWNELGQTRMDYNAMAMAIVQALSQAEIRNVVEVDGRAIAESTASHMQNQLNKLQVRSNRALGYV